MNAMLGSEPRGPPSPLPGERRAQQCKKWGWAGRRGDAWVPAWLPALLSSPGVLCSLLRPGEGTAWPPYFLCTGLQETADRETAMPFSPPFSFSAVHLSPLPPSGLNPPVHLSPSPHSVCLSSSLAYRAVFSLSYGFIPFLCLFLLLPHSPDQTLSACFYTFSFLFPLFPIFSLLVCLSLSLHCPRFCPRCPLPPPPSDEQAVPPP